MFRSSKKKNDPFLMAVNSCTAENAKKLNQLKMIDSELDKWISLAESEISEEIHKKDGLNYLLSNLREAHAKIEKSIDQMDFSLSEKQADDELHFREAVEKVKNEFENTTKANIRTAEKIKEAKEKLDKKQTQVAAIAKMRQSLSKSGRYLSDEDLILTAESLAETLGWTADEQKNWNKIASEERTNASWSLGWVKNSFYRLYTWGKYNKELFMEELTSKQAIFEGEIQELTLKIKKLSTKSADQQKKLSDLEQQNEKNSPILRIILSNEKQRETALTRKNALKEKNNQLVALQATLEKLIEKAQEQANRKQQLQELLQKLITHVAQLDLLISKIEKCEFQWNSIHSFDEEKKSLSAFQSELTKFETEFEQLLQTGLNFKNKAQSLNDYQYESASLINKILVNLNVMVEHEDSLASLLNTKKEKLAKSNHKMSLHKNLIDAHKSIQQYKNKPFDRLILDFEEIVGKLYLDEETFLIYEKIFFEISNNNGLNRKDLNISIRNIFTYFDIFIYQHKSIPLNDVSHRSLIRLLAILEQMKVYLSLPTQINMVSLISINDKSNVDELINDLTICVRAGVNISCQLADFFHQHPPEKRHWSRTQVIKMLNLLNDIKSANFYGVLSETQMASFVEADYYLCNQYYTAMVGDYIDSLAVETSVAAILASYGQKISTIFNVASPNTLLSAIDATLERIAKVYTKKEMGLISLHDLFRDLELVLSMQVADGYFRKERHEVILSILRTVNEGLNMDLPKHIKARMAASLEFNPEDKIFIIANGLKACARNGINIQPAIEKLYGKVKDFTFLEIKDVTSILFACYLHDTTSNTTSISEPIVKALLDRAHLLFLQQFRSLAKTDESVVIEMMFFANKKETFDNNSLKAIKDVRFFLQAATFYQYQINPEVTAYLEKMIKLNDTTTISDEQTALYHYLVKELSGCSYLEIKMEKKTVAGMSADIHILDKQTKKTIDIEYDGFLSHFYRNSDFTLSSQQVREDLARDVTLKQSGFQVYRFTGKDFGKNQIPSMRLKSLVTFLKTNSGTPAFKSGVKPFIGHNSQPQSQPLPLPLPQKKCGAKSNDNNQVQDNALEASQKLQPPQQGIQILKRNQNGTTKPAQDNDYQETFVPPTFT